jgi:prepilin-type N-terminal cleavage/methylation domain-containing protein
MKKKTDARGTRTSGFTLIELMIVVAIIGILAAIAIPKFANLLRQSSEGATKGNLGAIRSALSIYYGDNTGVYPAGTASDIASLTINGKYLGILPNATEPPYHTGTSVETDAVTGLAGVADTTNGWLYDSGSADGNYGTVWVNCTHTDTHNATWTQY